MNDFENRMQLSEQSSMLYWLPKIQGLDIPMPKTEILELPKWNIFDILGKEPWSTELEKVVNNFTTRLKEAAVNVQRHEASPVFIRTDQCSGKHEWRYTCFVENIHHIREHLFRLLENNEMVGWMSFTDKAIAVREYIPLESSYVAFHGQMPVAKERRYFIRDGIIECRHEYWVEDAIRCDMKHGKFDKITKSIKPKMPESEWLPKLRELNRQTADEVKTLSGYALQVAEVLDGYWSVDFAKAKDGRWLLIDMARGELSYHLEDCDFFRGDNK